MSSRATLEPTVLEALVEDRDRRVAVGLLVNALAPEHAESGVNPGRYLALAEALRHRSGLREALAENHQRKFSRKWLKALAELKLTVPFYHALAVLYREQLLAQAAKKAIDEELALFNVAYWTLLLSTREFWDHFSSARVDTAEDGHGTFLEGEQRDKLLEQAMAALLSFHSVQAAREYAAGRRREARAHARCLDVCRAGEKTIRETVERQSLVLPFATDKGLLKTAGRVATGLLDEWAANLVRDAERVLDDADAIARLPEGISKNFKGGIERLQPFVGLGVPAMRLLQKGLEWYNDWSHCLYTTRRLDEIRELMPGAREMADALTPLCTKGKGLQRENQTLSTHFLLRGFTLDDPEEAKRQFEAAVEWNPANQNASDLLGGAKQRILMKRMEAVKEHLDAGEFEEAYAVLDGLAEAMDDKQEITRVRAIVSFRHAHSLANEGEFREALKRAKDAQRLDAQGENADVIASFVAQLEELAPEERNLRYLKDAREALEKDRYEQAAQAASRVNRSSKYHEQSQRLQSAAHFHRAMAAAKEEDWDAAVSNLRRALEFNTDPEERRIIEGNLAGIENARIGKELGKAMEAGDWDKAQGLLRKVLAGELPKKVRQDVQRQLSMVLNAHAVKIVNEGQQLEKGLGDALSAAVGMARSRLH